MQAQGLQYLDITIPVNTTRQLSAPGKYFRFYSGQASGADSTITLRSGSGGVMCLLKPGQSIKLPEVVTDWYIGNYANAATITGMVVVGNGEIQDTNIAGSVSIIDGGMARTMAAAAYLGNANAGAVAAQYSHVQLFNPSASNQRVVVEAVSFSSNSSQSIYFCRDNTQRAQASNAVVNKLYGSGVGQAVLRSENNAVMQYVAPVIMNYAISASVVQTVNFKEPVVLLPGNGFNLIAVSPNTNLGANFEFFEQAL